MGCRFNVLDKKDVSSLLGWKNDVLNPAQILAWYTRNLTQNYSIEPAEDSAPAKRELVDEFLREAYQESTYQAPSSEWLVSAEWSKPLPKMDLSQLLAKSGKTLAIHRFALLVRGYGLPHGCFLEIVQDIGDSDRKQLARALLSFNDSQPPSDDLIVAVQSLLVSDYPILKRAFSSVLSGHQIELPANQWRSLVLYALDHEERVGVLEVMMGQLTTGEQNELSAHLAGRTSFGGLNPILADLVCENFVLQTGLFKNNRSLEARSKALQYPLEAAHSLSQLLTGRWAEKRLSRWTRSDPNRVGRELARYRPGPILTAAAKLNALTNELGAATSEVVLNYMLALGEVSHSNDKSAMARGPELCTAFLSILESRVDD